MKPLSAVLAAFEEGVHSLDEVCQRTRLTRGTVEAAVDQLARMGRLDVRELSMGCPDGGCGSCASGTLDGSAGCGSAAPDPARRGSVLVTIGLPPHPLKPTQ